MDARFATRRALGSTALAGDHARDAWIGPSSSRCFIARFEDEQVQRAGEEFGPFGSSRCSMGACT